MDQVGGSKAASSVGGYPQMVDLVMMADMPPA